MTDLERLKIFEEKINLKPSWKIIFKQVMFDELTIQTYALNENERVVAFSLLGANILWSIDEWLADFLEQLVFVEKLILQHCGLKGIIFLRDLSNLKELNLSYNRIEDILSLKDLINLTELDISHNKIKDLSPLKELRQLQKLRLNGNPIENPPPEIVEQGLGAIRNYWKSLGKDEARPLNEAKLLIVGQGRVGKTSLVNRITKDIFNDNEPITQGVNINDDINIEQWTLEKNEQAIRLNIWDFGGQEIMHATHKFFLTKRSLYLLMLDAQLNENENKIDYWLKIIESFGGDSPILIAINKTDLSSLDKINRPVWHEKYKGIKEFFNISCKKKKGIKQLKKSIAKYVNKLDHVHDMLPNSWFVVKNELEKIAKTLDFMPYEDYENICKNNGVDDELSQYFLIETFHRLGIVLNFRDDFRLQNTNILNANQGLK